MINSLSSTPNPHRDETLYKAAQKLEAVFLADMLESAGYGKSRTSFGGGSGENQFSSFLVQEQSKHIVAAGGIGLAESLYNALKVREND